MTETAAEFPVRIRICSTQYDPIEHLAKNKLAAIIAERSETLSLRKTFSALTEAETEEDALLSDSAFELFTQEQDKLELVTEGVLSLRDGKLTIQYSETELTGMDGATTAISFDPAAPSLITMLRDGSVKTALVFEPHRRHICAYETPAMPLEICIYTRSAENTVTVGGGKISLDYLLEFRANCAYRNTMTLEVFPLKQS